MSLGFIMLVHTALDRAAQVATHWASAGKPIVIHVDNRVPDADFDGLRAQLAPFDNIIWCPRLTCEWGGWSIVEVTQNAATLLLDTFPDVSRVYLASGSCLPLRGVDALDHHLKAHPGTDFIESVTTQDVDWTVGGLAAERFTLRFPFSWMRRRRLFDGYVRLQRRLRVKRKIPDKITPHLGSQWWCLTRPTLTAILNDPDRERLERYFKRVWIPDESYFQTLVRLHSNNIESRSLTLSKFGFQGKPHVFYDDHVNLLRRSNCFVARKAWPHANGLYDEFLGKSDAVPVTAQPNPLLIDRLFTRANDRRIKGRRGLYMPGRYPETVWTNTPTARRYTVLCGFSEVFEGFAPWLANRTGAMVHGNLFAPDGAVFANGEHIAQGGLAYDAKMRDYRPIDFLRNLIWNNRAMDQAFMFSPDDAQKITRFLTEDKNATIYIITGAWAVPLMTSQLPFSDVRRQAAVLQRREAALFARLSSVQTQSHVRIWSLSDFVNDAVVNLHTVLDQMGVSGENRLREMPKMADLDQFGLFLQRLRNEGMNPHLMGDFSTSAVFGPQSGAARPKLVKTSDG